MNNVSSMVPKLRAKRTTEVFDNYNNWFDERTSERHLPINSIFNDALRYYREVVPVEWQSTLVMKTGATETDEVIQVYSAICAGSDVYNKDYKFMELILIDAESVAPINPVETESDARKLNQQFVDENGHIIWSHFILWYNTFESLFKNGWQVLICREDEPGVCVHIFSHPEMRGMVKAMFNSNVARKDYARLEEVANSIT